MSGDEFLRAWEEGRFRNGACDDPGVAWVSTLVPLAEPRWPVPAASPKVAVEQFLRPLRRMVSCITPRVLNVRGGYHPSQKPHTVLIGAGLSVPLAGPSLRKLRIAHIASKSRRSETRGR